MTSRLDLREGELGLRFRFRGAFIIEFVFLFQGRWRPEEGGQC